MVSKSFSCRLRERISKTSPLCVGVDPHPYLLDLWGLPNSAAGIREFSFKVLEATEGCVAAIKPQIAFFERYGSEGIRVLEDLLVAARKIDTLTIVDAKRGDIGTTMGAYAETFLSDSSSLVADAVTLSPYLGFVSLDPAISMAESCGRGVFVLALTSNMYAENVQHARFFDEYLGRDLSVAESMVIAAHSRNKAYSLREVSLKESDIVEGSCGIVVGATVGKNLDKLGIDLRVFSGPILVPGFGSQGATLADLANMFGDNTSGEVLINSSRNVLESGPGMFELRSKIMGLAESVNFLKSAM